jgi:uncharacterized protein (TIGR03032 family)
VAESFIAPPETTEPLQSVHTSNFPALLQEIRCSLLVSTYQAGKLVIVRADDDTLNTHFRLFQKPMGIAANQQVIALGASSLIWEFRNVPAATTRLPQAGKHDSCYIPRKIHVTGDIDIHEMAWGQSDLWFVNTRFSCLCTLDADHSFVPRWRPPFVSAYAPEDRCHLNGLDLVNGVPKYVTALGQTDTPSGWREHKARGGVLIDVETNQIIYEGLSMPHSPRWYQGQLWVLESGEGSLVTINPDTGEKTTVAVLEGFTRGLDFFGPLAFIGLSQVRETAVFSDIPITERLQERICGVWVVHIETGQTVAFLRFEDAVQEIFAVNLLPGILFPEVVDSDAELQNLISTSYVLPDEALQDVPENLKT